MGRRALTVRARSGTAPIESGANIDDRSRRMRVPAYFLCAAMALIGAAPCRAAPLQVIDAMPAFWRFWGAAADKPEAVRVRMFRDTVVAAHPELFDTGVLGPGAIAGPGAHADPDAIVGRYLSDVTPFIPRMQRISETVRSHIGAYAADFSRQFPLFAPAAPVYFTVSMFSFDGATRTVGNGTALLFGIDGIARSHPPDENLKVLFDHELFHLYHSQIRPELTDDAAPLWTSMWEEGLATYVSGQMNPGSTEGQVLLQQDLPGLARPRLGALARALLARFDSLDRDDYEDFFYLQNRRPDLPPRSGYYVGYRVARMLGAGRTLEQLARLQGAALKAAVRAALEQLAAQP